MTNPSETIPAHIDHWNVLKNGPLEQLSPRVLRVEGSVPGMPIRRVMTVVKNAQGGLVIHNGICLNASQMAGLERFGRPEVLVVPGAQHRLDAWAYAERYPDLVVICPKGAREAVDQVVPVTMTYDEWESDGVVGFEHLAGTIDREGVMHVVEKSGRTLVFNDIIFNMPHLPGFYGFIFKYITRSSGGPRISRLAKRLLVSDRNHLRAHLQTLSERKDLVRLITSHHQTSDYPADALKAAIATL